MKCVHTGRLRTLQSPKTNNGNGQTCSAATFIMSTSISTDQAQFCSRSWRSIKHPEDMELLADLIQQQEHVYSNKIQKRRVGGTSVTDRNVFWKHPTRHLRQGSRHSCKLCQTFLWWRGNRHVHIQPSHWSGVLPNLLPNLRLFRLHQWGDHPHYVSPPPPISHIYWRDGEVPQTARSSIPWLSPPGQEDPECVLYWWKGEWVHWSTTWNSSARSSLPQPQGMCNCHGQHTAFWYPWLAD